MISKKMENMVANSSAIRAMFEEGNVSQRFTVRKTYLFQSRQSERSGAGRGEKCDHRTSE